MSRYIEDGAGGLAICDAVMIITCKMFCHTSSMVVSITEKSVYASIHKPPQDMPSIRAHGY